MRTIATFFFLLFGHLSSVAQVPGENKDIHTFVIGLGSNKGDRLSHLRSAMHEIRVEDAISIICASRIYISQAHLLPHSPPDWDRDYFNAAIKITTTLAPEDLLRTLKKIEAKLGRPPDHERWSPRRIDLDILSWENHTFDSEDLTIPHPRLLERSFALRPLLDIDPSWTHPCHPQLDLDGRGALSLAPYSLEGTKIMGVINLTPISMSGPNQQLSAEELEEEIVRMTNAGAEVIDVGAESTRPHAEPISPDEEWQRLQPLIQNLATIRSHPSLLKSPTISIDTYHAETVRKLRNYDVDVINDVYGFEKEKIASYLKDTSIRYVLVHNLGKSGVEHMEGDMYVMEEILDWFSEQIDILLKAGLRKDQIILDPGIGFGKTYSQTSIILSEIHRLQDLGYPILVGHSRKASAMPSVKHLPPRQRDLETAYLSKYLSQKQIDFLRVHNCLLNRRLMDAKISTIVAHQLDRGIGYKNRLPWNLKKDLENFKRLTLNKTIVMGRKTYESIGHPLKSRQNVVISTTLSAAGQKIQVAPSLSAALCEIDPIEEIFIIGGESLYKESIKCSDKLYLTVVQASEPVDTFFSQLNPENWIVEKQVEVSADQDNQFPYTMKQLQRIW